MMLTYTGIKLTIGVLATFGLYSVLYRENKFYRFWEHVFLGLAAGWALVTLWVETLYPTWWSPMVGRIVEKEGETAVPGYWVWALMAPIGIAGYFVFSRKHSWIARIPVGIIIGLWSGQQFNAWINKYIPQLNSSMLPIFPTTWSSMTVPVLGPDATAVQRAEVAQNIYLSQAVGNLIATITMLAVLTYFLFGVDLKSKFLQNTTKLGRYLLMIGFGAIFGSTVMMRFSLLIDRMYFIWIEWFQNIVMGRGGV
jgi:hypothetical protein